MHLIVGLGNPGKEYENTRHNIGFDVLTKLSNKYSIPLLNKQKYKALVGSGNVDGKKVILAMPQTFMNLSGEAVYEIYKNNEISVSDIIVVYDEMDLNPWDVKIKIGGSSAGHNGIESIIQRLVTKEFVRVRIGIGRSDNPEISGAEHVLSKIPKNEQELKVNAIDKAVKSVVCILSNGTSMAMNEYNKA